MNSIMTAVRGRKLRSIFSQYWTEFAETYQSKLRPDIVENVTKMLTCRTSFLGHHLYQCNSCDNLHTVYHTCKSRFCSSCGKKITDNWVNHHREILPKTRYQHITFTLPKELQDILWSNRELIKILITIPAAIITNAALSMGVYPGIFLAMHTAGRDLKRNIHFHLSTTLSGLSTNKKKWIPRFRFNRSHLEKIKISWRNRILKILKIMYAAGTLIIPDHFIKKVTTPCDSFSHWLEHQKHRSWVVHFSPSTENHEKLVSYLGRYLKKPPIGETRIKKYDDQTVTYDYFDHHDKKTVTNTLPGFDFIKRVITHIPDKHFRMIRYYNWFSNRTRGQFLPFVYAQLNQIIKAIVKISWRDLLIKTYGIDPLRCSVCKIGFMVLRSIVFAYSISSLVEQLKIREIISELKDYL